ncbi:hypothetical protein [[Mycoplasma] imitans]|uniref:hypothetical protein n=1 Tax=[Mycoplasma] imitans TaxID=29560 RepID=UPI000A010D92|nr:hypothetical protein [[Mycoplasma] imitans]
MNQKTNSAPIKNNNLQQVIRPSVNLANKQPVSPNNNVYQAQAQIVRSDSKKEGTQVVANRMQPKPGPVLNQPRQPNNKVAPNLNGPRPVLSPQNKAANPAGNLVPNNLNRNLNPRPTPNLNSQAPNNKAINPNPNGAINILNKLNTSPNPGQTPTQQVASQQAAVQPKPNPNSQGLGPKPAPTPRPSLRNFVPVDETSSVDEEEQNEAPITSLLDFSNNQPQAVTTEQSVETGLAQHTARTTQAQPTVSVQPEQTVEATPTQKVEPTKKVAVTHPSGMTLEEFMRKKQATNLVIVDEETIQKQQEEKDAKAVTVAQHHPVHEEVSQEEELSGFEIQYEIWRLKKLKKFGIGSIFMGIFSLILSLGVLGLAVLFNLQHFEILNVETTLKLKLDTFNAIFVAAIIVYVVVSSIYRFLALVCVLSSNQIGTHKKVYSYDFDSLKATLSFSVFFEIASLVSYPVLLSKISKAIKLLQ